MDSHTNDNIEQRRSERVALNLRLSVRQRNHSSVPATVASLSRHGCLVTEGLLLSSELLVWVKLPGLESQAGRLVWTDGAMAGVAFHQPLHVATVARFREFAGHAMDAAQLGQPRLDQFQSAALERVGMGTLPVTRRDQIMAGHAEPDAAILRRKKKTGARGLGDLVTRTTPRRAEHRREERHARLVQEGPIRVTVGGDEMEVANISPSGIKVRTSLGEGVGRTLPVEFEGFPAFKGRVIWIRNGHAGIELPPGAIELNETAH